ncbi:MAG: nucleoside 2-deoxyribosyltransferase [Candidatus Bathyarchaeia archaeon]
MKKTAFISGPIQGMETQQDYRQAISETCRRLGFEVIDPWQREKILYNKDEACWWNNVAAESFVQRDLDDADRCDVMIVYLPRLSAGACMELFYAKRKGKKVVVVSDMPCLSPWIVVHSDRIVKRLADVEQALRELF